jgi:hypothetical protein
MSETIIVRIGLFVYAILCILALILLWKNAAATDALKNAGILLASILPVLIVVLPYINYREVSYNYNYILIYDSKKKTLVTGDHWNVYESIYRDMFVNISKMPEAISEDNMDNYHRIKGLDIIEKGIVGALINRFISHWDVVWQENRGPGYVMSSAIVSTEDSTRLSLEQIRESFVHNRLISTPELTVYWPLCLPPKSTLKTSQPDGHRIIRLSNDFSLVSIEIRSSGGIVAQQGVWGVLQPDPEDMNRFYALGYQVSLTIRTKRMKQYAPEMEAYSRWYENIRTVLSRFDWDFVVKEIEHESMKKAISKTLDN